MRRGQRQTQNEPTSRGAGLTQLLMEGERGDRESEGERRVVGGASRLSQGA